MTTLEEVWNELDPYSDSLIFTGFDTSSNVELDSDDSEEMDYVEDFLVNDEDEDDESEDGPVLAEDLQEALNKCTKANLQPPQQQQKQQQQQEKLIKNEEKVTPTSTTATATTPPTQENIASAIETAFHRALADVLDSNRQERRPLSSRRKRKSKAAAQQAAELYHLFSGEISEFWDGWFDEIEVEEEISSLEEEIYSIEEELARMQEHKRVLRNVSPSSPVSPPSSSSSSSPSSSSSSEEKGSLFVEIVHSPFVDIVDLDSDTNITGSSSSSSSDEKSPVLPTSEKTKKKTTVKRNSTTKIKRRKTEETAHSSPIVQVKITESQQRQQQQHQQHLQGFVAPVHTSPILVPAVLPQSSPQTPMKKNNATLPTSKPKRKLNFKNSTAAKEVFKVEQVLKISTEQDCEDEDVDIGDLTDGVNN